MNEIEYDNKLSVNNNITDESESVKTDNEYEIYETEIKKLKSE